MMISEHEIEPSTFADRAIKSQVRANSTAGVQVAEAMGANTQQRYRGRLFRRYLLLILSLVTIALLASGAISVIFSYQENKSALTSLQHEKAVAAASRIEQYVEQIVKQLTYAALPQLEASYIEARRNEFRNLLSQARLDIDRKSTRLNSSHVEISYAVFCLKKKRALLPSKRAPSSAQHALP